jgi:hypothetical protein
MKILNKVNVSRDNNGPRKFSLELTTSGVISIAIVALLGMCWAFILGILLGRGYRPENAVPPLANIMPTTEAKAPDETVGAPPKVLKPEELQFMEGLQDKDKDGAVVADSAPKGGPGQASPHPGTSQKPGQGRSEKAVRQTRRKAGWRKIPRHLPNRLLPGQGPGRDHGQTLVRQGTVRFGSRSEIQ